MQREDFLSLPTDAVARIVQDGQVKTCAFPINGTRRWFLLEQPATGEDDPDAAYVQAMVTSHIRLYKLFFQHGIETLLTPIFGPDLLERGEDYAQMAIGGIEMLATHPDFLAFYRAYGVRVGFYGDYRQYLEETPYAYILDVFDAVAAKTADNAQHALLFGVFAHNAAETTARLGVSYYQEHGTLPDQQALVEMYYGQPVAPLSLFIGFDKFSMFDVPLITHGHEDLYFTVSPSLYLTERQLRLILFDHLYTRRLDETDYAELTDEDLQVMRRFYALNREKTQGIGGRYPRGEFWYPLPQVVVPAEIDNTANEDTTDEL